MASQHPHIDAYVKEYSQDPRFRRLLDKLESESGYGGRILAVRRWYEYQKKEAAKPKPQDYRYIGWRFGEAKRFLRNGVRHCDWRYKTPKATGWRIDARKRWEQMTGKKWHLDEEDSLFIEPLLEILFTKRRLFRQKPYFYKYFDNHGKVQFEFIGVDGARPPWVYVPRFRIIRRGKTRLWVWEGPTAGNRFRKRPVVYREGSKIDVLNEIGEILLCRRMYTRRCRYEPTGEFFKERVLSGPKHELDVNPANIRLQLVPKGIKHGGKYGAANANAKLSTQRKNRLLRMHREGFGPTALSRKFGISRQQVYNIIKGKCWNEQITYAKPIRKRPRVE